MENNILKIEEELTREKKKLEDLYYTGKVTFEEIQNQSIKVDEIVVKYMETQIALKKEKFVIEEKYKDILNQPYRLEVRNMIWSEVRLDNPNIGPREMEQFVTNVFVYCCLLAHNISEQEIVHQLIYLNNTYFNEIYKQEAVDEEGASKVKDSLEYLKHLKEKYTKIIKERI